MRLICAITLALSGIANSAIAVETVQPKSMQIANLHENEEVHEDLIAAQELIALGCMGKLSIAPISSGRYDSTSLAKIQQCADNAGTDIGAKVLDHNQKGDVEKARMPTYMLHYAVLFAKKYNSDAQKTATADLIKTAREQGRKHYPYLPN